MNLIGIYIIIWMLAILAMFVVMVRNYTTISFFSKNYREYLGMTWKIVTYLFAMTALSAIAPIANDPTWDIPESIIMATLTFLTAPWAVGVIYRAIRGYEQSWKEIYLAIILWLFSASWSYDLYVWIWQGTYPLSWSGNLAISPILYLCAGMFWNLEWTTGSGVIFAFTRKQWFLKSVPGGQFGKLLPYMSIFALLGLVIFGGFLYVNM